MNSTDLNVLVNGRSHHVTITKIENNKLEEQRKLAKKVTSFIKNNPSIALTLCSLYVSYCGLNLLWFRFEYEGIELFDYVSIPDLFFGFFSVSYAPVTIALILLLCFFGFLAYKKEVWKSGVKGFWIIMGLYIFSAPLIAAFLNFEVLELDKIQICSPQVHTYEIEYIHPNSKNEKELYLIASLSDFKIFKKSKRGCNVAPKAGEKLFDFYVKAISSDSIRSMEYKI